MRIFERTVLQIIQFPKYEEDYSTGHEYIISLIFSWWFRKVARLRDARGSSSFGDVLLSFRSPHSSYIRGRARPILTSPLALSLSLHSRRHHRKLRTSFPRGGCPIEKFKQLDRRKTFLPDLSGEQTASSSTPFSTSRVYVRAFGWYARSRSPASLRTDTSALHPTRTAPPEY